MEITEARKICQDFANEHKIVFEDNGEVGFGRPCVGLMHGDNYLDYNPRTAETYQPVAGMQSEAAEPTEGINAYHKHECFAVLASDQSIDESIIQLAKWIHNMKSKGTPVVKQYQTGATGMQAMLSGVFGYCIVVEA